ncbi:hypothetical protein AU255_17650 [Methyloprofundus sedimenti]|uniref:Lipoprotein n=1 Tax=Methyloprofundus sedimenti TaxID=1420851 RepID=A0A1V8M1B4_9GAMM|nr:hypothetical protein [Methyloprofundus sedimenti]OQK15298.1 hypothetical protein AU255_17650 [Methyloprofundus sedimenti]
MKKILIISLSALILTACSEQEEYQETVLEQIKNDSDIQSYHLEPETVTKCIVELSSKKMPGIVPFDPMRKAAYKGYTKMISTKTSEKPEEILKELRESFGSAQGLSDAHRNYTSSYLECMSTVTNLELDEESTEETQE